MIPPVTTVLNRLLFSVWRLAMLAGLVASTSGAVVLLRVPSCAPPQICRERVVKPTPLGPALLAMALL
jgi:hypothetical protein